MMTTHDNLAKNNIFFINIFPTNDRKGEFDLAKVAEDVTAYSVDIGFKHTLITVGDKRVDPWTLAQFCSQKNPRFSPLVAVNPFYQHPMIVAKKLISMDLFYQNEIAINLVTGSFFNELKAVKDELNFEQRSLRLKEFYRTLKILLSSGHDGFSGQYYHAHSTEIFPKYRGKDLNLFVSGNLAADFKEDQAAHFVSNIRPIEILELAKQRNCGLGLGICTRETRGEAIAAAEQLFPLDRKGQMLFSLSLNNRATPWNRWMNNWLKEKSELNHENDDYNYYLRPMKNFWSTAPYIIGSYEEVAIRLGDYVKAGYSFFILDFLPEEAIHVGRCLDIFRYRASLHS